MQRRGLPEGFHIWFTDEPFSVTQERRLKSPAEKRLKPVPGLLVCTSCGAGILPANHQGQAGCPSHKIE
ncbi:hypothetical protein [Aphanizomenon sp. UHCC 0183]|uniref:hypothetical protein n=1 Tax=Aphanizomenon sp. UHCC 0183 TaxID=2590028 RepID=UPI001446BB1F|nr:hypothetical protein [Aphanizomenon sp. UHCC 0183]MTJ28899.1 hypothetical protein [Aphanizomenon sp. UHCC 0183]